VQNVNRLQRISFEEPAVSRVDTRHSHISIGLRFLRGAAWEHIEALGWHEGGFNFFYAHDIDLPTLEIKRGLTRFSGEVMWSSVNTSDEVALGTLVNELIYQRAQSVNSDPALRERLIKLIRIPGMVAQKQKVLASLGHPLSNDALAEMLEKKRLKQPLFHFGIRVDAPEWREIVKSALSVSSVVVALEKWSDAIGVK
jgi:hypothetical protein